MRGRWPSWSLSGMPCAGGGTERRGARASRLMRSPGVTVRLGSASCSLRLRRTETGKLPGGQVMAPSALPGRRAVLDGDLENLIARQRIGWFLAGGFPVWPDPGCGGLRRVGLGREPADLAGDSVQHARAGDPALHLLAVAGQHGQPVAAVRRDLAQ